MEWNVTAFGRKPNAKHSKFVEPFPWQHDWAEQSSNTVLNQQQCIIFYIKMFYKYYNINYPVLDMLRIDFYLSCKHEICTSNKDTYQNDNVRS